MVCRPPGSFCGVQLLAGPQLEKATPSILQLLSKALVAEAPMQDELGWLLNFPDKVGGNVSAELLKLHCQWSA